MLLDSQLNGFFCFNDTAPTEIYTLSLHDALPILGSSDAGARPRRPGTRASRLRGDPSRLRGHDPRHDRQRSEEHTSELQSQSNLVCRLLLEKKNKSP